MGVPLLTDGMRRRLERCAAAFHVRTMEILRDLPGNPCGVRVRPFGDDVVATVATAEPDVRWEQHVAGLTPDDVALVPKVAAWYHLLGVRPRFELAPAPGFRALADALADARARHTGFIDVLWARAFLPEDPLAGDIDVCAVTPGSEEATTFARVLLAGHEVPDTAFTEHWAATGLWAAEPEWSCYLALVDGEPAGAAALAVHDGIGYLANAATVPSARGRGAQQALIERRLLDAHAAGCELFMTLAEPGTTSHRNLERAGLSVAYTKAMWTVE